MRVKKKASPRVFRVGGNKNIAIKDTATIELRPDEQVTLLTDSEREYDVVRKNWGFYATPSLNSRLAGQGLLGVLAKNEQGRYFVLLVEEDKEREFQQYCGGNGLVIICWLNDEALKAIEGTFRS